MSEKLQKVLARAGYASRREIERWIEAGRIEVNGRCATLGDRVDARDRIAVDGKRFVWPETQDTQVLLYHKPEGVICTRDDPEGRETVFDQLPRLSGGRWICIGRLDINTSGLLLLTNNGELASRLMHPSTKIEREYAVRVLGQVDVSMVKRLTHGVPLEDGMARFEDVVDADVGGEGANHWFHVVVCEGRNRLVRRLWASQGITVSRLKRVRFGPVSLHSSVRQGQYRALSGQVLHDLMRAAGME